MALPGRNPTCGQKSERNWRLDGANPCRRSARWKRASRIVTALAFAASGQTPCQSLRPIHKPIHAVHPKVVFEIADCAYTQARLEATVSQPVGRGQKKTLNSGDPFMMSKHMQAQKIPKPAWPRIQAFALTLILLLSQSAVLAFAQAETGAISGTVSDPNGAVVSGAAVVVKSVDNGSDRRSVTGDSGTYTVSNLQPGV